jgi:hypothetical protein
MSLVYRMPSLDRAAYVAALLQGTQIEARGEMRSRQPFLVVEADSGKIDAAVHRIEPRQS